MMTNTNSKLIQSFQNDYEQLRAEFDKFERTDSFHGPQMEALVRKFLQKWENYMEEVAEWPDDVKQTVKHADPFKCSYFDSLEDDARLAQMEIKYQTIADKESHFYNNYKHPELDPSTSAPQQIIGDIYRRACEAIYLRVTYNKARLKKEDDRREPVRWGQRALRYDPHSPRNCLTLSVSLGWCLDAVSNPREQTIAGETFKLMTERTLRMEPRDMLAHHLLGIYFYQVGGLNWFQRTIVKKFLGCKVEGSYADSEREFRLEFDCKNDWLPTGLWMAKVLLAQGKPMEEVKHWIDFGLQLKANEPTTEIDRDELLELARKLKV